MILLIKVNYYMPDKLPADQLWQEWVKKAEDAYAAAQRIKEFVLSEIAKKPAGSQSRASNDN